LPAPSWSQLYVGKYAGITLILNLGIGLHAVDIFIVATIMPSVVGDIGGAAFYAWTTMLYMVASIVGAASSAPIKAGLGLRRCYFLAALGFLAGSAICAVAPDMPVLLLGRVVKGLGGGLLIATNMMLVREVYPDDIRTRALSTMSAMWGMAAMLGPLIGGIFAEFGGWRGAFWFSVPIIILFSAMAWRRLPESEIAPSVPRFPIYRLAMLGSGVLCVAAAGNIDGFAPRLALIASAFVLVAMTFRRDHGAAHRLFPTRPLSLNRSVGTAYWIMFLFTFTHSSIGVFIPLVVQVVHGASPLIAGYFTTVMVISWTAATVAGAGLQGRAVRFVVGMGPLLLVTGMAGVALVATTGPLPLLAGFICLAGLGIGSCLAHMVNWTMTAADPGEESVTASSIPTVRSLGIAFGSASAGLIANTAGLGDGISVETVTMAANWVYGVAVVPALVIAMLAFRLLWLRRAIVV
jgi:MFS family permease